MSISLLSGPGGLAACLRAHTLGAPYTSLSQPLDVGRSTRTVPPHLRKAVIQRDKHCQFPGCYQPPSRCDAHHLIHWSKGGPTSLGNLRLLCKFHHLDRDSPLGLDTDLPPRRHHHRHQPRRTHPALPRATRKDGVTGSR